jgi:hypothetical protein
MEGGRRFPGFGNATLKFSHWPAKGTGRGVLAEETYFSGSRYPAGTPYIAEAEATTTRFGYLGIASLSPSVDFSFEVGLARTDTEVRLKGNGQAARSDVSRTSVWAGLGIAVSPAEWLTIHASASIDVLMLNGLQVLLFFLGLDLLGPSFHGHDLDLGVEFQLGPVRIDAERDLRGFYLSATIEFQVAPDSDQPRLVCYNRGRWAFGRRTCFSPSS